MNPDVRYLAELARCLVLANLVRVGGDLEKEQEREQGKAERNGTGPVRSGVRSSHSFNQLNGGVSAPPTGPSW